MFPFGSLEPIARLILRQGKGSRKKSVFFFLITVPLRGGVKAVQLKKSFFAASLRYDHIQM